MTAPSPRQARVNATLALVTAGVTIVLISLGGIVWSTGSALACPDWPLCYGQFFPRMVGQVLYEHGHRLVAGAVALCTLTLAVRLFADARLRGLALLAAGLVLAQALLGGLTVLLRLPLLVRVLHLAFSQAFFATMVVLSVRAAQVARLPDRAALFAEVQRGRRGWLLAAALAVYAQLLLGAFVRHTYSGMACQSPIGCAGRAWPAFGPGQVQMAHRYGALAVAALVIFATVRALPELRQAATPLPRRLAIAAHLLVLTQIALGVASVLTFLAVPIVTLHLVTGALLWADLAALWALSAQLPALKVSPARESFARASLAVNAEGQAS